MIKKIILLSFSFLILSCNEEKVMTEKQIAEVASEEVHLEKKHEPPIVVRRIEPLKPLKEGLYIFNNTTSDSSPMHIYIKGQKVSIFPNECMQISSKYAPFSIEKKGYTYVHHLPSENILISSSSTLSDRQKEQKIEELEECNNYNIERRIQ